MKKLNDEKLVGEVFGVQCIIQKMGTKNIVTSRLCSGIPKENNIHSNSLYVGRSVLIRFIAPVSLSQLEEVGWFLPDMVVTTQLSIAPFPNISSVYLQQATNTETTTFLLRNIDFLMQIFIVNRGSVK